ncbi:Protein of unknown function [Rhodococcus triatomae]|uniref:Uncharacterized protein n=1 Tax=Rhodococcus triatomae TaxID=300028 RepID=A0A1G8SVD8_9NOCA|nr:Protein of unknown function [Rhodococcus triatomae]
MTADHQESVDRRVTATGARVSTAAARTGALLVVAARDDSVHEARATTAAAETAHSVRMRGPTNPIFPTTSSRVISRAPFAGIC